MSSSTDPTDSGSLKFKDTKLRSLGQIFSESTINSIPYYQRDYSWKSVTTDERPVAKLWDDFITKYNDWVLSGNIAESEYMLGTMVFVKQKPIGVYDNFEIVDGQQRISTITMILCIVRDIVIENNFSNISRDMNSWPNNLESFVRLVEIIEEQPITTTTSERRATHKDWKLKMNRVDAEVYKKWIQEYRSDPDHHFSEPGKDFMKISEKIKYLDEQLKSKNPALNFSASKKLVIQAYVYLYNEIQSSLIVSLLNTAEANEKLENLDKESKNTARKNIEGKPENFELPNDFFTNDVDGYNILNSSTKWTDLAHEQKFDELYEKFQNTKRGKDKSRDEFIKSRLSTYLKKFNPILGKESTRVHDKLCAQERKNHLPQLFQFINNIVMQRMFVTRSEVKEDKDAFQIFDTMNSAGLELSKSNLIKNLIIKHVPVLEQENIAKKWDEEIIDKVGLSVADTFILQSLRSRGLEDPDNVGKYIFDKFHVKEHDKITVPSGKNLYNVIRWKIDTSNVSGCSSEESKSIMAKQFIDNLVEDALIYEYLVYGDTISPVPANPLASLDGCIYDMNYLGAKYIRIAMYTAYREWTKTSNEFILLMKFLVPFFFKYKTIGDNNASKLESNMITVCEMIKNGDQSNREDTLYDIVKFLLSTYSDGDFKNDFENLGTDEKILKYILHRINTYLADKYADVRVIDNLELEHILPKSPKKSLYSDGGWELDRFFTGYDTSTEPHYQKQFSTNWVWMLGNLTLLHYKTNKTIGNSNFGKKLLWKNQDGDDLGYSKSQLPINIDTLLKDENGNDRQDWTALSLIERTEILNDKALEVWKLPEIFCSNSNCYGSKNPITVTGTKKEVLESMCCDIRDVNGQECSPVVQCGNKLIVKWHKPAPEYRVPQAYTINL